MPFRTLRWLVPLVLLLLAGAGAAAQARAQGFGQNKVQYKDLDWAVLETDHFLVHFYSSEREAAVDGARMAERAYTRLSTILRHDIEQKIPLILYASPSDFQTTNISPELIGEGTGGFTEYQKRRVTLPFTGGYDDLDHVLTHELVHAFQVDILFGSGDRGLANPLGTPYVPPLWFMEGMAEYLSVTKVDNLTEMWLRDASLQGYLIPLDVLSNVYDIRIYRFGQSIFSYIGATFGDDRIGELLKRVASTRSAERAFQDVLGMTLERFSDDWMENVRKTYLPTIAEHHKPEDFARRLTDAQRSSASYHLAPAVSPNGADMVYLSDHSLYNALYLASALDGRVQKRLIQGERRAEFESLRFLNASMDFSPDGKTVAFAAKAGARDAIYLQRLRDGKILRKIDFPLDGIQNPSFSNDGDWIVFVGLDGGRSDLYRCRVDGRDYERLTNDRFLAQSPRFSPDDRSILFVTDQGPETDFRNLLFSKPTLAILDLPSGRITPLPGMTGSNTAPHYFPDGRHILYVSDRTGIPNLYVRDLASHADARITDILTGVTGIIPLAPAVSLARDGSRCVFSCFTRGSWDLYAIKDPLSLARFDVARGEAAGESEADSSAGIAAPPPASPGPLTASRDPLAPSHGPDSRAPEPEPAQAPSLDSAGEPDTLASVAGPPPPAAEPTPAPPASPEPSPAPPASPEPSPTPPASPPSADSLRAAEPDSILFRRPDRRLAVASFDDSLSERPTRIGEVFALYRSLPDTSGFKIDDYRVHFTIDYAAASGFFASNVGVAAQTLLGFSDVLGNHNLVIGASIYGSLSDSDLLFEYVNLANRINYGIALYQLRDDFFLTTAQSTDEFVSQIYRGVNLTLSRPSDRFRRIELNIEGLQVAEKVYQEAYYGSGIFYEKPTEENNLYFARPGIALVEDNTVYGITGPISGARSRLSFDVSLGDVQSTRWIVDRRHYWNVRQSYAFAARMVGASSQGRDPQTFRIGGPYTLRGYPYGDLDGSNVGLLNLEFRFPLIETLQLGWPLPIGLRGVRGAIFFDAGAAWRQHDHLRVIAPGGSFRLGDVKASYGLSAAMNIGFAILRWDLAQRTDLRNNLGDLRGSFSVGSDF